MPVAHAALEDMDQGHMLPIHRFNLLPVRFFSIQAVALTAEVGFWSWRQRSPDLRRGGFIVRG
ncbi:hypothetical protein YC2023_097974 [Brassica napus]